MFEWDEEKRLANLVKHGVDFADAGGLDWDAALTLRDTRGSYGEERFVSILPLGERLHVCVWTWRKPPRRLISLRKANRKEEALYAAQDLYQ